MEINKHPKGENKITSQVSYQSKVTEEMYDEDGETSREVVESQIFQNKHAEKTIEDAAATREVRDYTPSKVSGNRYTSDMKHM
jgi:hypothetical protein